MSIIGVVFAGLAAKSGCLSVRVVPGVVGCVGENPRHSGDTGAAAACPNFLEWAMKTNDRSFM
jgi:hypothetical protein